MKELCRYYAEKLKQLRYLHRGIILCIDTFLCLLSTLAAYYFLETREDFNFHIVSCDFVCIIALLNSFVVVTLVRSYSAVIRLANFKMVGRLLAVAVLKQPILATFIILLDILSPAQTAFFCIVDCLVTFFLLSGLRVVLIGTYEALCNRSSKESIFIFSSKPRSVLLAEHINRNIHSDYRVVGFLSYNKKHHHIDFSGLSVYTINDMADAELLRIFQKHEITTLLFSSRDDIDRCKDGLINFCVQNHIRILITEEFKNLNASGNDVPTIKPIQIEDLLDRDVIEIEIDKINKELGHKSILITGAAGSIGSEIVRQLAALQVKELVLLDNAETPLHSLMLEMQERYPESNIKVQMGDVRSLPRMQSVFERFHPDIVFHAAAYKHVPMVEHNPCEGVLVNILGTYNVAQCAIKYGIEKFVMVSTDKAVNPTNVMGATKRAAELCVQALNATSDTHFVTTRFGNVLGSNGSVIPRFKKQIAQGGPVTVTHPDIIRYFMTIPEACRLVLQAASMGQGGEIFVFDMGDQVKIADLARKMIVFSGYIPDKDIKIVYTGLRPGEKLYEELLTNSENTAETRHQKIRKSRTQSIDPTEILIQINTILASAQEFNSDEVVRLLKLTIPEFKSKNSKWEKWDATI